MLYEYFAKIMKTLILNVPVFSGKIISPTWIKAVRDFQSRSKAERDLYCSVCGCTGGCNLCDDIRNNIKTI